MFVFDTPPTAYADPWKSSFDERFAALNKGQFRIAYLYEKPDSGTFRYRVYNMIQVLLEFDRRISAAYFTESEFEHLSTIVDLADLIVLCRTRYNDRVSRIIIKARNQGKKVFFDIDDLLFDVRYAHLMLRTIDENLRDLHGVWDGWFASFARMGLAMQMSERIITTNAYLASKISEWTTNPVDIVPNFLNKEQMQVSERIYDQKKRNGFARSGQLCLGYFSGSPTHNKDFEIVSGLLAHALEQDPRFTVRIVGYLELTGPIANYKSRIEFLPMQNFVSLQRLIGQVEVNLMPSQENAFTNCKSELKYFEAAIVGTLSIASPTFTYAKAIRDGENGYLAQSFEWSHRLARLLESVDSSYAEMAECAFDDSVRKYAWSQQAKLIENVLLKP